MPVWCLGASTHLTHADLRLTVSRVQGALLGCLRVVAVSVGRSSLHRWCPCDLSGCSRERSAFRLLSIARAWLRSARGSQIVRPSPSLGSDAPHACVGCPTGSSGVRAPELTTHAPSALWQTYFDASRPRSLDPATATGLAADASRSEHQKRRIRGRAPGTSRSGEENVCHDSRPTPGATRRPTRGRHKRDACAPC